MLKTVETQTTPALLELETQHPAVTVRELAPEDDQGYFEAVQHNKAHLQEGGLYLGAMYRSPEDVAKRRQEQGSHRMGVWFEGKLVGGVDAIDKPDNEVEVSYWLDDDHTGLGIARASVRAVTDHYNGQGMNVRAEVEPNNYLSRRLLGKLGYKLAGYDEDEGRDIFRHAVVAKPASLGDTPAAQSSQSGHIHAA